MSSKHSTTLEALDEAGIRFVRVTWIDLANFVRYRVVPIAHFRKLLAYADKKKASSVGHTKTLMKSNPHGGIQIAKVGLGLVYLAVADGFPISGEYVYAPDLSSARLLPFAPGHASVLGWFEEKEAPADAETFEAALCPRAILRKIIKDAKDSENVDFLVGFETEVIFLKSTDPIEAVNDYGWSESGAISAGTPETIALEEIADALEQSGIELQMYHAEAAPGQTACGPAGHGSRGGRDNRETPVRLCGRGAAAGDVHFEVKSVDGTAVPHLAVAALLAAVQASELSEAQRMERGVTTRMPLTIEQAHVALEKDVILQKALGEHFVKSYLSVNKTLDEQLKEGEGMTKLVKTF
ncbi:hypothetical protein EW145_g6067 [Phellinidium pouzarii]|uniref:Glutamine synthetase n=1 Tax=Phellinidium pouzarii TaxID=167371 RepID=A0A4S4KXV3_9AGAM|nr:hypothetical protein EW145_g6067 [Phellinidium pouzarii]